MTVYNASEILTYDFAVNCALVNSTRIPGGCPFAQPYDLSWQLSEALRILHDGSEFGSFTAENSLFVFFLGINDASISVKNNAAQLDTLFSQDIAQIFQTMDAIYALGFRKFMFVNLPRKCLS